MKNYLVIAFILLSIILKAQKTGNLVIVGGALSSDNKEIYEKFIELSGGKENCFISVIPTASGCALESGATFKKNLEKYGVKPEQVYIAPIAVVDCPDTPEDDSKFITNAEDTEIAKIIEKSTGVWFTGGDQSRTLKALKRPDGTNTPVLDAIYKAYNNGACIAGTSAGAAIMSNPMITGGVSISALKFGISDKYIDNEQQDNGPLTMSEGLGFFTYGIVDQHFDKKNRLGRLIVACVLNTKGLKYGFGVDENSALVYYSDSRKIEAIGEGGVTIIDATNAKFTKGKFYTFENVLVSYIEQNDKYDLINKEFEINTLKKLTTGNEYYNVKTIGQAGILSSYTTTYKDLISFRLVDNKGVDKVTTYCFDDDEVGLQITFEKTPETKGYWSNKLKKADSYSFTNVKVSIYPVKIKIQKIK